MKIGYLVPEFPGQTHAFFRREVGELARRGVEVELVSTRRPKAGRARHEWADRMARETSYLSGGAALAMGRPARLARIVRRLRDESDISWKDATLIAASASALARRAARGRFSHVHVHSCAKAADVARAAGWVRPLTYSLTLHSPLHQFGPRQDLKWRDARFGVAVTRVLEASARAVAGGATPVGVAPMGVDLGVFSRGGSYAPWCGHGPLRLVTCGRLNPCKGHDDAVRAVRLLRDEGLPAELTVIGGTDGRHENYPDEVRRLAGELGVADAVRLVGSVGEREVAGHLSRSHAFVLASRNEAIGVATMEAMAMGLPVVVTGCPGVEELVDSAEVGRLVPVDDPAAMARAVGAIARDPAGAVAAGQAARRRVEAKFHSGVSAGLIARMLGVSGPAAEPLDVRVVREERLAAV